MAAAALPSHHSYQDGGYPAQDGYPSQDGYPTGYSQGGSGDYGADYGQYVQQQHQPYTDYSDQPAPVWGSGWTGSAAEQPAQASSNHSHSNSAGNGSYWDASTTHQPSPSASSFQPQHASQLSASSTTLTPVQSAAAAKEAEAGLLNGPPRHSRTASSQSGGVVVHQDAGRAGEAGTSAEGPSSSEEAPPPQYQ